MKIRDYAAQSSRHVPVPPEVVYAGECLERMGDLFGVSFTVHNAIDKAAEMLCVFMDEDVSGDWKDTRAWFRETGGWVEYT